MNNKLTPLKALENLKNLSHDVQYASKIPSIDNELEVIETALKALEIIKEKRVNIGDFVRCKNIEDYNEYCCYNEKEELTQEEFDLLKKVLS